MCVTGDKQVVGLDHLGLQGFHMFHKEYVCLPITDLGSIVKNMLSQF